MTIDKKYQAIAPDMTPFNADPKDLMDKVVNPERIRILAPGEVYRLNK